MGTKKITLSPKKRLSCGLALGGILLSASVFGLATAETTETKVVKPVRILLTDDTADSTLSVRRKSADQRNIANLYNNDLRPKKVEPNQADETEVKSAPSTENVKSNIRHTQSNRGSRPVNDSADQPQADLSTSDSGQVNHQKPQFRQTQNNRGHRPSTGSTKVTKSELPDIPSFDTLLPTIEISKVDLFGEIESVFKSVGNELSSAASSATSPEVSKFDSKLKHPGRFTPRYANRPTSTPVHMPTIGSIDGIQLPKTMLADINSIFGIDNAPSVDEAVETPAAAPSKLQEKSPEATAKPVKDKQSAVTKEPRRIIELLGLEELGIPEFNNPFAVGTGIKEPKENIESVETPETEPALDESGLDPDETITSELPSLKSERPDVPGLKQIPTLAPKEIPNAPNAIDEKDKSASRNSSYKTLVNPDNFLPRTSAVPVSVRISDTVKR